MSVLLKDTERMVKEQYGKDAELKTKMENGVVQWWVKTPGSQNQALAAASLRDMNILLSQTSASPPENKNGDGLLNAAQVAAIVKCKPNSVGNLYRTRGLRVAQWVPGRGGEKPRFRLEDVMEWTKNHAVRHVKPYKRSVPSAKPMKAKTASRFSESNTQISFVLDKGLRNRLARFVNKYNRPPFSLTLAAVMTAALQKELDRMEKEFS